MKAFVISDTNRIIEHPTSENIDLIITCGDLMPHDIPVELGKPIFGVFGGNLPLISKKDYTPKV